MIKKKLIYTYDIETISNFFCAVFQYKNKFEIFEISERKDDSQRLVDFLKSDIFEYLIGFNSVRFDMQVLECFLRDYWEIENWGGIEKAKKIYTYSQDIITRARNKESPPFYEGKLSIPQIDPYLINHYNNINKATSLKWLEFTMGWDKVQDIPFKHDNTLSIENFDMVIEYCKNDVAATREFALKCKELINLRLNQHNEYPDLMLRNKSDSSIGEALMLEFVAEAKGVDKKVLKKKQTHHSKIPIIDCLLPYINFKTEEFNNVLSYFKESSWTPSNPLKYSVIYGGIPFDFGEGGLHASVSNKIFDANDEYEIRDVDVTSFYPMLSIVNGFTPAHLGNSFCTVYKDIFNKRKTFPKGSPQNASYKIILNGAYGKAKDIYSFIYDVKFQLQIVINGQLLLTMLAERLSLIDGCTLIQCNTDGITLRCKKDKANEIDTICKKWENLTKLQLEQVFYKRIIISDVNNYMAQGIDNKLKYKGRWEIDGELHKNNSQRIVQIALRRYFIEGIPIMDTLTNHCSTKDYEFGKEIVKNRGILDFCIGKKVKSNQKYVLRTNKGEISIQDKVIRFYVSKTKDRLLKIYADGREESVVGGHDVKMYMEHIQETPHDIDYNYYLNECLKITTPIEGGNIKTGFQQTLF